MFAGLVGARTQNCHTLPLSLIYIDYSSWILNLLLNSLFVFWLALRARQNTAQLVKIYSDTTHQNI